MNQFANAMLTQRNHIRGALALPIQGRRVNNWPAELLRQLTYNLLMRMRNTTYNKMHLIAI